MKTIFVVNEETGKVAGSFNTDQHGDKLTVNGTVAFRHGQLSVSLTIDVITVVLGDAIAFAVISPNEDITKLLLTD